MTWNIYRGIVMDSDYILCIPDAKFDNAGVGWLDSRVHPKRFLDAAPEFYILVTDIFSPYYNNQPDDSGESEIFSPYYQDVGTTSPPETECSSEAKGPKGQSP